MTDKSKFGPKDLLFRNITVTDPRFTMMRDRFKELKGKVEEKKEQFQKAKETKKRLEKRLENAKKAQALVQLVLKEIQETLQYSISHLVTLAEASVFDDPYGFVVKFESRRGKTDCDLMFSKGDNLIKAMGSGGGGTKDVGAVALTCSFLIIDGKEPVLIIDEPFHNINDPSRELHRKAAQMLKEISNKLEIQMIIVTGLYEIVDVADKVFTVWQDDNGYSYVKDEDMRYLKYLRNRKD